MSYETQKFVAAGIAFLDEQAILGTDFSRLRNWRSKVDLTILDVDDGDCCILGQLFDTYPRGIRRLELSAKQASELGFLCAIAAENKFDLHPTVQEHIAIEQCALLTIEWKRRLNEASAA